MSVEILVPTVAAVNVTSLDVTRGTQASAAPDQRTIHLQETTRPASSGLNSSTNFHWPDGPYGSAERPQSPLTERHLGRTDDVARRLRNAKAVAKQDPTRYWVLLWGFCFILTLDGGGVRGYSQLLILKALMDKVEKHERDTPINGVLVDSSFHPIPWSEVETYPSESHRRRKAASSHTESSDSATDSNGSDGSPESSRFYPHHYFDWIAGTSTGGLNAIMLSRLRMSVDDCLEEYADLAKQVFRHARWASYRLTPFFWPCAKYNKKRLEHVVSKVVKNNLREGEGDSFAMNPHMCKTIVFAWGQNLETNIDTKSFFRSYAHHRRQKQGDTNPVEKAGPADSCLIWQAARATSAAPSYFNSIRIGQTEYVDGGFGLNNPSQDVFYEVSQVNRDVHEANAMLVSIGTGISRFNRNKPGIFKRPLGWLNAAKKVSTDSEKAHADMNNITDYGRRHKYYRLNVPEHATDPDNKDPVPVWRELLAKTKRAFGQDLEPYERGLGSIKLDEWKERGFWRKESTKDEINRVTQKYIETIDGELDDIAKSLVLQRRARAETHFWEAYALGIRYECPMAAERCPQETFTVADKLRDHLIHAHKVGYGDSAEKQEQRLQRLVNQGRYREYHH